MDGTDAVAPETTSSTTLKPTPLTRIVIVVARVSVDDDGDDKDASAIAARAFGASSPSAMMNARRRRLVTK